MKIFEKFKYKLKNGKYRVLSLCDIPIVGYEIDENKNKKWKFYLFNKYHFQKDKCVLYLKVNAIRNYTLLCLQNWINIADTLDYDFVIICDNDLLKKKICDEIIFPNSNIKFIKSVKNVQIVNLAKKLRMMIGKRLLLHI